jgi:putative flippase GtrA
MTAIASDDRLLDRLRASWRILLKEVAAFGLVGAVGFAIQIGLLYFFLHLGWGPLTANGVSMIVAVAVTYVGNRYFSFSHRARTGLARETSIFLGINAIAFALSEVMVAIAAYPLGYKHHQHVIVGVTVFSIGIGTLFRFWSYKRFVFLHPDKVHDKHVGLGELDAELAE